MRRWRMEIWSVGGRARICDVRMSSYVPFAMSIPKPGPSAGIITRDLVPSEASLSVLGVLWKCFSNAVWAELSAL